MKKITKEISYQPEWTDIEKVDIQISEENINTIKKAMEFCKDRDILCVTTYSGYGTLLENNKESDFRHNGGSFQVFETYFYWVTYGKHDGSQFVESEEITLKEIS